MITHKTKILESLQEVKPVGRPIRNGIVDLMVSPAMRIIPEISNLLDGIDEFFMTSLENVKRVGNLYRPYKDFDDVK